MKPTHTLCAVAIFLVGLLNPWVPWTVAAEKRGTCIRCGAAVVVSPNGTGVDRQWRGVCRDCSLRSDFLWRDLATERYALFADGTTIDMQHFRVASLLSAGLPYVSGPFSSTLPGRLRGVVLANMLGWFREMNQARQGYVGGQPWGGNEDLASNYWGSVFAQTGLPCIQSPVWGRQALWFLEGRFGRLQSSGNRKP